MTEVAIRALFRLSAAAIDEESVVSHVDAVMAELLRIESVDRLISSSAVSLDLSEATVLVELLAQGADFEAASARAEAALTMAMATARGVESSWATKVEQQAELLSA